MSGNKAKQLNQKGFSLLELMIVMFIMIILISVALPAYQGTIRHAEETVLKDDLFRFDGTFRRIRTDLVRLANDFSAEHTGTGEKPGEARAPMITTGLLVDFWRTTKFSENHDHCIVEQSARVQIIKQS